MHKKYYFFLHSYRLKKWTTIVVLYKDKEEFFHLIDFKIKKKSEFCSL